MPTPVYHYAVRPGGSTAMKNFRQVIVLFFATMLLFGIGYPLLVIGISKLFPQSSGLHVTVGGELVGYENIGQPFSEPCYFWGRPSAVDYDASATGGSNLGPTNPDFLQTVQILIADFQQAHPGVTAEEITVELVTASGIGLDLHISWKAALIQIDRVAQARRVDAAKTQTLVDELTEAPLLGLFGPADQINVLKLNVALDERL